MPREIITIQIGQCGNQSISLKTQSAQSFGSNCARSMALVQMESLNNLHPITKEFKIGKMSSSIKLMMTTTFPDRFW